MIFFNFFPIIFAQFGAATVVCSVGWRDVCTNIQNYSLAIENIDFFFISTDGQNGSGKCGHVFTNRTRQKRTIGAHRISCVHACIAVRTVLIPLTVKTNSAI